MKDTMFFNKIHEILNEVEETQIEKIRQAANLVSSTLENDGIIYTFGTGHSHMVAEELCYRAGGIVPVDAILEPSLTGNEQMVKSTFTEQLEGYGKIILNHWRVTKNDVLIVISNSGRNASPVDVALEAKQRKIPLITISSSSYAKNTKSRHSCGKNVSEFADIAIDNCGVLGDATIKLENLDQPMGPTSNIIAISIAHAICIDAVELLLKKGLTPPVFLSGTLDKGWSVNKKLLDKYWERIRIW